MSVEEEPSIRVVCDHTDGTRTWWNLYYSLGEHCGVGARNGTTLVGDRRLRPGTSSERLRGFLEDDRVRQRIELDCSCGRRYVARSERVETVLQALSKAGVSEITLGGLMRYADA